MLLIGSSNHHSLSKNQSPPTHCMHRQKKKPPAMISRPKRLGSNHQSSHLVSTRKYHFSNFICGPSNEFAHAAARAVAAKPGRSYNPLFLFGDVGLGKTHLLSAIGHTIQSNNPDAKIVYQSSESFANEVVDAVLNGKLEEFRRKYREETDVLLMDDIQLLAGKERTPTRALSYFQCDV